MTSLPLRSLVLSALVEHLAAQLHAVEAMASLAVDEATSDETRSEGKYDTRSIEASYLARGQAERVAALRTALSAARSMSAKPRPGELPAGVGSLLVVETESGERLCLLLAAVGGGARFVAGDTPIRVLTPDSPLGRALLGASEGDEVELDVGGRTVAYEVVAVR